jgi:crotonobetainyl-CoA:carnitine CoA-transferase CaiB-like acyl-CoA transferase
MSTRLEGIKVVELSTYMAAAVTGKLLAQFGADVIKIDPVYDDPFRTFGKTLQQSVADDENACWQWSHANKRAIALDQKTPEGRKILFDLLKDADVFITNYKADSLARSRLTYDDLKDEFPHLIYGWLTGYGLEGPWKDEPGFDGIAYFARPGFQLCFGDENTPILSPGTVGDTITGTNLFTGILLSLLNRSKSNVGEMVDVSLYGTSLFNSALHIISGSYYGFKYPKGRYERLAVTSPYKCSDGKSVLINLVSIDRGWKPFCREMGLEEYADDPRFESMLTIRANGLDIHHLLEDTFVKYSSDEVIERCLRANCPATVMGHYKDKAEDPQGLAAGYLTPYTFPSGKTMNFALNAIHFTNEELFEMGSAPTFGEHSREILESLGYSSEQIQELIDKQIVGAR